MFTPEFLTARKNQLEAKKAELEAELLGIAEHTELGSDYGDAEMEIAIDLPNKMTRDEIQEHIGRIEAALAKIADGTYGVDADGNEIDAARLEVYPEAEKAI